MKTLLFCFRNRPRGRFDARLENIAVAHGKPFVSSACSDGSDERRCLLLRGGAAFLFSLLAASISAIGAASPAEPPTDSSAWNDSIRSWRNKLDANDPGMKEKWFSLDHGDSTWKTMSLPRHHERGGLPGHDGTVWFRRAIQLSEAGSAKEHVLELGPIDDMDMAWVNGELVGGIEVPGFWLKPRKYPVPARLLRPGRNVIAVRVIDHGWSGGFAGAAKQMKLVAAGQSPIPLHGNWSYRAGVALNTLGLGALPNPPKPWTPSAQTKPQTVEAPAFLRPLEAPTRPVAGFKQGFKIDRDQTIVIFGGSNAAECQRNGWLELRFVSAHPKHRVTIRNMAWPADTVFQQLRPRNFFGRVDPDYGEKDGREPIKADIAILWFGQMESLAGSAGLPEFAAAYERLIDQAAAYTGRLVVVAPTPFEDPLGLGFDLNRRNRDLKAYSDAIKKIAEKRELPVVDLTMALDDVNATSDGALLSEAGHEVAAAEFARQLGFSRELPQFAPYIRESIREKNLIWNRYWLPSNWAFLYGNRQTQPSSRDHQNRAKRWFPKELKHFLDRTEQMEEEIRRKLQLNER